MYVVHQARKLEGTLVTGGCAAADQTVYCGLKLACPLLSDSAGTI